MDAGEGSLKPNHKKNSFHPYTKENSAAEGKYLRSCSDPIKLLEFLMNIDDPPKFGGYDGDNMRETAVVKRKRATSDILGPGQRVVHKDRRLNRWSMPATLEQWSQNFRAHLTNNGRSRQKSRPNEMNATPVKMVASDETLSSTSGMSNVKRATNVAQRKLDGVSADGSRRFLSSLKRSKDVLQDVGDDSQCIKPKMRHRWSLPVAPYSILQSIIDNEVTQSTEVKLQSPEDRETDGGQLLKRRSRWRWSLPLLKSSRSSTDLKDPNPKLQSKDDLKVSSRSLKMSPPATELKIEPGSHSSPEHPEMRKQAPSFSDITDDNPSSPNTVKVFVDSTYAEQNNGFHCSDSVKVSSSSSSHLNDNNFLCISSDGRPSPASLKADTSTDDSGLSAILRDPGSRSSAKKNSKKRLSWKREKSLENVCYLERFESTEFEDEGISAEEVRRSDQSSLDRFHEAA